jgi:hypothetical protein
MREILLMDQRGLQVIGWKESVDIPDWGIENLVAKADTGARRSAIDVANIIELPGNRVQFDIALHRKRRDFVKTVVASIDHQTHVRSSNGQQHERYFVRTQVRIGHLMKEIELSLVCRRHMTCRMLLGRKALEGDFLVDSTEKHVTRKRRRVNLQH